MEEKERYEVKRLDYSLNVKLVDNNEPDWRYIIFDSVNDKELAKLETVCDWFNQQYKQIKDLKEKHNYLFEEFRDTCKRFEVMAFDYEHSKEEIKRLTEENQQLKQQLHDLPKKIVEEIKLQLFNHFKVKNIEEYEKLPLIDSLFTADTVIEILDTILKKFGGEDVKD